MHKNPSTINQNPCLATISAVCRPGMAAIHSPKSVRFFNFLSKQRNLLPKTFAITTVPKHEHQYEKT